LHQKGTLVLWLLGGLLFSALLLFAVFWAPIWLVELNFDPDQLSSLDPVKYVEAVNETRGILLQALAGFFLVVTAFLTWRKIGVHHDQQIAERYTRAVEQLKDDRPEIRIGALLALERVAKDSPADRDAVDQVVAAYARDRANRLKAERSSSPPSLQTDVELAPQAVKLGSLMHRALDLNVALEILGRRSNYSAGPGSVFLEGLDAEAAHLDGARFDRICFRGANFHDSHLNGVQFKECSLHDAKLTSCELDEADFTGADLRGTDFSNSVLEKTTMRDAKYNERTNWPKTPKPFDESGAERKGAKLEHKETPVLEFCR